MKELASVKEDLESASEKNDADKDVKVKWENCLRALSEYQDGGVTEMTGREYHECKLGFSLESGFEYDCVNDSLCCGVLIN